MYTAGQKLRASQMSTQACTSGTRPVGHTGQTIYETDTGRILVYTGSAWRSILPETTVQSAPGDSGTVTSTTYTGTRTGTSNVAGVAFKAPTGGAVRIDWACGISNSGGSFSLVSIEVRQGTSIGVGTTVLAPSDSFCLQASVTAELKNADWYVLTGLTPQADYNVRLMYRVGTGTGTFNRPKVLVASAT